MPPPLGANHVLYPHWLPKHEGPAGGSCGKEVRTCHALLLPRSEYSNQQRSVGQSKICFERVLVREKLFLKN